MKCALLCRVSSKEQEETGYSLPAQEKLLTGYGDNKGFSVAKIFSITESASGKKQREIFDGMMDFVKKENIKVIICEKVDRLTRNFKDAVDIDEWLEQDEERQVHLVKDSLILHKNSRSQEKLNWGIRILFAKNYIDNLSEEVKKGQKEKIAQGWLPTKPPLGYKTIGEKGHKTHVIDEDKMPLIKKMFQFYAGGGYSLKKLTEAMEEAGLRNESGSKVYKSRIHTLLTEPFYIGKNRWNDQLYDGKQEIFISQEVFERVQQLLRSKTTPKYSKHNHLFKGMMRCAECGGTITWELQKGHIYGHCNHYRNCSQKTWFKEAEVEEQLIGVFEKLQVKNPRIAEWIRKAIKDSHKDEIAFHSTSVTELQNRLTQIEKRFEKIYDDKLDGAITEEFYQRKSKQYATEKEELKSSLAKHDKANTKYYELAVNIYDLSQRAKEIYLKAKKDVEKKRKLLRLVIERIIVDEGRVSFSYTKAFLLISEAIDATNRSKLLKRSNLEDKIFEPVKKIDNTHQTEDFYTYRPILLPG